jgi:hypothetical protein
MLEWLKGRRSKAWTQPEPDADRSESRPVMAGAYLPLHRYLHDRYANTVVLTFAEIESLLGFALPDLARQREGWWTAPEPDVASPGYADSWILAGRTARPNLRAVTVVFDRA